MTNFKGKTSQRRRLLNIMESSHELWHDDLGNAGATLIGEGRIEHFFVNSKDFQTQVSRKYYKKFKDAPLQANLKEAIFTIEGKCKFEGKQYQVFNRIGYHDGKIFINLANDGWDVIEVSVDSWELIKPTHIKFIRTPNMLPLPIPERGGSIDLLREFINSGDGDDSDDIFHLITGFILKCFEPEPPYPVLIVTGEQKTGKSDLCKLIVSLVDPSKVPIKAKPKTEEALIIAAKNSHVLAIDNVSKIPFELSDALCRLSTGGGLTARKLYTNDEESAISASRPVLLNGITDFAERPDLLDRAIVIDLPILKESHMKCPRVLAKRFQEVHPLIFGVLLDAIVLGLRDRDSMQLSTKPRMIGAAQFITAAEQAFGWPPETFLEALLRSQEKANKESIALDPIGSAIMKIMENQTLLSSKASELLNTLRDVAEGESPGITKSFCWPKTPNKLSAHLKRIAPQLRKEGYDLERGRNNAGSNITIQKI